MISHLSKLGGMEIADAIRRSATVCAATQRLSRALVEAWNGLMREEGRSVWRTPDILPFGAWQRRLNAAYNTHRLQTHASASIILDEQQELLTWEQAASAAGIFGDVLQPLQLSAAMMDAHALAAAWDIHFHTDAVISGADSAAFLEVREQAELRWRNLGVAPAAFLPWSVIEAIRTVPQLLPREIVFVGFDLPADAALRETQKVLKAAGVRVVVHTSGHDPAQAELLRFPCFEDELHDAAQWCRTLLESDEENIGIIIPHLDLVRSPTERVFSSVLQPASTQRPSGDAEILFELSLGPRAIDEPLIHSAFLLLEIQRGNLPVEDWTRILHSPFLRGSDAQGNRRALLDAELRRRGLREASASDILHIASIEASPVEDHFLKALERFVYDGARRLASEWAGIFLQLLDACGWPGERKLSSREYQARERFRELLQEFSALDTVLAAVPLSEALGRFRLLAAERVFQTRSVGAPVQIMGVRESVGLRFSHCRVLAMNDDIWPPVARPTAFIPLHLQHRAGVPAAIPERFLAQVREETALLFRVAEKVTFTCSRAEGDRELLPTPLLSSLSLEDRDAQRTDVPHALMGSARALLDNFEDPKAPPVDEEERIRGGTTVIARQSDCPFRAFAELRLHATQPDRVEHGLRALDRGNLIHSAMERFWLRVGDHTRLCAMSDEELRGLLHEIVDATLREEAALGVRRIADHLIEAEHACLMLLLGEWLEVERSRTPFGVEGCEVRNDIRMEGLTLHVRADRIDRLADGSAMLIDYKSGNKSVADWMSTRPTEPQIPLYLQAMGAELRAAAFAIVRRGNCHYSGLRDDGAPVEECSTASEYLQKWEMEAGDWAELRARWADILAELAAGFMSGDARVDPRDGAKTCEWCTLRAFCRIGSGNATETEDEDV
ncbi:MAG: PD-(D/E)XK nuclease family protein [Bacteroidetes bacterium]|nr:PD-(D/E)XK nuclease family protein [Bacteroidota bacterium]